MNIHAPAKLNLCLFLGPRREDGLHELCSLFEPLALADAIEVEEAGRDEVICDGVEGENLAAVALERLRELGWERPPLRIRIAKRIPVAAGLGGGSADAAAALTLANGTLATPLDRGRLLELAAGLGSDVPFFVEPGPKLVEGAGERLRPLPLPQDYWVLVALPAGVTKGSTGDVYRRFDELAGPRGYEERRARVLDVLGSCSRPDDLASLPANDLARAAAPSALTGALRAAGAFRSDVSGAGPAVYALFRERERALTAEASLPPGTRAWVVAPVW
jgi:4-diphosphocytidyl-2-C-methyl-D-erythritol kinase